MFNILKPKVNFSLFLQTNHPKSIKKGDAGFDLFVPHFSNDFFEEYKKLNKIRKDEVICDIDHLLRIISFFNDTYFIEFYTNSGEDYFLTELDIYIDKYSNDKYVLKVLKCLKQLFKENETIIDNSMILCLRNRISIPSGLMIDYPKNFYGEMVNRSSNFKNNINVSISYCDNNFVLPGNIFQINRIDNQAPIIINQNQRIGQMLLRKYWKMEWKFLNNRLFNSLSSVVKKKAERDGGLGSSGR